MSSILTNTSAMVALQTLKSINMSLGKTQAEISTGKSVASARDNAAIWAISKVMESDVAGFKAISESLSLGSATAAVARNGAEQITDLLEMVKEKVVAAQGQNVDRTKLQTDVTELSDQITSIINASQFNGKNLLNTAGGDMAVLSSLDRDGVGGVAAVSITVASVDFEAGLAALLTMDVATDDASAAAALVSIETLIQTAIDGAAALGSSQGRIDIQSTFMSNLTDAMRSGIGAIIDADMEESSAKLQALQVQVQLGIQALSIANQQPQNLLALFR